MPNPDYVEEISASIVREYLSRKGFGQTLKSFEKEHPRTSNSVNSRSALIKCINIERLVKKNKDSSNPYRTLFEIIINYLLHKYTKSKIDSTNNDQQSFNMNSDMPKKTQVVVNNTKDINAVQDSKPKTESKDRNLTRGLETFDAAPVRRSHRPDDIKRLKAEEKMQQNQNTTLLSNSGKNQPKKPDIVGDLEVEELSDIEVEGAHEIVSKPSAHLTIKSKASGTRDITYNEAKDLRLLLFGSESSTFSYDWMKQGFTFNVDNRKLNYGLIQYRGGPCGLLAAIQAFVIRYLYFGSITDGQTIKKKLASPEKCALACAIAHVLWTAADGNVYLTLPSKKLKYAQGGRLKFDGFLEYLEIHSFDSYPLLYNFIEDNLTELEGTKSGCVLILYSIILSRGFENIKQDMDSPSNLLIGAHGYCSQEMVNLFLTGRASSNVFDNSIVLDGGTQTSDKSILKGICQPSKIGFLSLFEHYNSCQVGSFMKNPEFPIWVICSESHFSLLFSLDVRLVKENLRVFDLYYFDGLAQQDDEIRLTVDLTRAPSYTSDLIPPIDCCIRTKWKNASVDWNNSEPIL